MPAPRRADPPPLEADLERVVVVGTACWTLALVALGLARLAGASVHGWWLTMCLYGALLGLLGVLYCRRRPTGDR